MFRTFALAFALLLAAGAPTGITVDSYDIALKKGGDDDLVALKKGGDDDLVALKKAEQGPRRA